MNEHIAGFDHDRSDTGRESDERHRLVTVPIYFRICENLKSASDLIRTPDRFHRQIVPEGHIQPVVLEDGVEGLGRSVPIHSKQNEEADGEGQQRKQYKHEPKADAGETLKVHADHVAQLAGLRNGTEELIEFDCRSSANILLWADGRLL